MAAEIEVDNLLDGADEEVIPEPTLGQQLSRLGRAQLTGEAKARGLSGAGSNTEIIARIEAYEQSGGVVADSKDLALAATSAPVSTATPSAPAGGAASAPAGSPLPPVPELVRPAKPKVQKVGFFERTNTWRSEFTVGPRDVDDSTHSALIEATHGEAAATGLYYTLGAPSTGMRIGYSTDANGSRSVVYEVFAREVE